MIVVSTNTEIDDYYDYYDDDIDVENAMDDGVEGS